MLRDLAISFGIVAVIVLAILLAYVGFWVVLFVGLITPLWLMLLFIFGNYRRRRAHHRKA